MAMKKGLLKVYAQRSLERLDLSCNRIVDLDEAGLDRIPRLAQPQGTEQPPFERLPGRFLDLDVLRS